MFSVISDRDAFGYPNKYRSAGEARLSFFGNDSFTKLLLHMDEDFVDDSAYGRTPSLRGDPTFDTTIKKFGSASGEFDGNDAISYPDSTDFNIGTGSFTIECQIYFTSLVGRQALISKMYANADIGYSLSIDATNGLDFVGYNGAYNAGNGVIKLTQGDIVGLAVETWHHVMLVRNGTVFNIYLNGVSVDSGSTASSINYAAGYPQYVAYAHVAQDGGYFTGKIDEARISIGVARQTGNFEPPTRAYG